MMNDDDTWLKLNEHLGSIWGRSGVDPGSIRDQSAINFRSICGGVGEESGSLGYRGNGAGFEYILVYRQDTKKLNPTLNTSRMPVHIRCT